MNQRSRNRYSDAAVLGCELVQRSNSRRIAQHYGDLTTTRNARGLALGASFWLGHNSPPAANRSSASTAKYPAIGPANTSMSPVPLARYVVRTMRNRPASTVVPILGSRAFAARVTRTMVGSISCLQGGPIPPMDESYTVTSDNATTILQVAA